MSWLYRTFARPLLFTQDPENVHNRMMRALAGVSERSLVCDLVEAFLGAPLLPVPAFGLRFPNPIGLAAGMDKHGEAVPAWAAMGFGFSELGGVTALAQPGNPAPRVFRVIPDQAIVNRMGFNNEGAAAMAERLAKWRAAGRWPNHPVGINLGKSKATALDRAAADYAHSFSLLRAHADFFVVNVSSPNTPNLRQLQDKAALDEILAALQTLNAPPPVKVTVSQGVEVKVLPRTDSAAPPAAPRVAPEGTPFRPILVKVAPDLSFQALDDILELVGPRLIAGLVATNTTITRPETRHPDLQRLYAEEGGLSGRPLRQRSTEVIRHLYRQTEGKVPIIGVGGIFSAGDAWEKILAGATLVQVYTGLVYEGPGLPRQIVKGLRELLLTAGCSKLEEAVGRGAGERRP
jgi:dihydroorotate dehydrogenase